MSEKAPGQYPLSPAELEVIQRRDQTLLEEANQKLDELASSMGYIPVATFEELGLTDEQINGIHYKSLTERRPRIKYYIADRKDGGKVKVVALSRADGCYFAEFFSPGRQGGNHDFSLHEMQGNMKMRLDLPAVESNSQETENDKELREDYMIGKEGICEDYFNQIFPIGLNLDLLSKTSPDDKVYQEAREGLLESINVTCMSYSQFAERNSKKPRAATVFTKFLTERGREIWKRLDEIVAEIKLLAKFDLKPEDLDKLKRLYEEAKGLIG